MDAASGACVGRTLLSAVVEVDLGVEVDPGVEVEVGFAVAGWPKPELGLKSQNPRRSVGQECPPHIQNLKPTAESR